jgi:hypothetical protein
MEQLNLVEKEVHDTETEKPQETGVDTEEVDGMQLELEKEVDTGSER